MKRRKINKKKEIIKIRLKKTKNLTINKRIKQREPDIWKEVYSGLKLFAKKYKNFRDKQNIKKQKKEQIRLKDQEEQRLQEQEEQRLQEQEERKLQKEQRLNEEKERRLKAREEKKLKEKQIKDKQQEREKQEHIYKERVVKGYEERLKQLEKVRQLRQEEKQLKEESGFSIKERKLKEERKLQDQGAREPQEQEERKIQKEQKLKGEGKRPNGKVKWFNDAKGYGFIERKDEEKDIFVHFSAVKKSGLKSLEEGEQLTFEIKNSDKGPSAINLRKVKVLQKASVLKLIKNN